MTVITSMLTYHINTNIFMLTRILAVCFLSNAYAYNVYDKKTKMVCADPHSTIGGQYSCIFRQACKSKQISISVNHSVASNINEFSLFPSLTIDVVSFILVINY